MLDNEECDGYTGYTNDIFCQPIDVGQDYYCLELLEDPQNCAAGDICNADGNCVRRVVSANHPVHAVSKTPMERAATVMLFERSVCDEECAAGNIADTGRLTGQERITLADNYELSMRGTNSTEMPPHPSTFGPVGRGKVCATKPYRPLEAILATHTIFGRIY